MRLTPSTHDNPKIQHYKLEQHSCSVDITLRNRMPQCPVCSQYVKVVADQNADHIMNEHISSGCRTYVFQEHHTKKRCKICSNPNNYDVIICKSCTHQFCLTHRHPDSHRCSGGPSSASGSGSVSPATSPAPVVAAPARHDPRSPAERQVAESRASALLARLQVSKANRAPPKAPSQSRSTTSTTQPTTIPPSASTKSSTEPQPSMLSSVSNFVSSFLSSSASNSNRPSQSSLINARWHASARGDESIPSARRVYLSVHLHPSAVTQSIAKTASAMKSPVPVFVDSQWSVGRCIDFIANATHIKNNNDKFQSAKLHLCVASHDDAQPPSDPTMIVPDGLTALPWELSVQMLNPTVRSGDDVTLALQIK